MGNVLFATIQRKNIVPMASHVWEEYAVSVNHVMKDTLVLVHRCALMVFVKMLSVLKIQTALLISAQTTFAVFATICKMKIVQMVSHVQARDCVLMDQNVVQKTPAHL
jgi:hypothetical protein